MVNFSESFASIREWAHRRNLRSVHKATLKEYTKGVFDYPSATISIGDALEKGIFDPQYLRGDKLMRMAPDLDERVWSAWHESSRHRLDAYKDFYYADEETLKKNFASVYTTLMNFENVIQVAGEKNGLGLLKWLHALEAPWRPFEWQPAQLVGSHREVGSWALDTFEHLNLSRKNAEHLAKHLLWDQQRTSPAKQQPDWIRRINKDAFQAHKWSNDRQEQQHARAYAQRVLDVLLPPDKWDWKKRWELIGKDMALAISSSGHKKDQVRLSSFQGAMLAALLHEAPADIQTILCAFKRARHPDEPNKGHPDAQLIRHHFFDEKPPASPPSALLSATFLFVNGVDPDVEVGFVLEQLTRDPTTPVESYPLDGLDLTSPAP